MSTAEAISVVLADDSVLLREGIARLLVEAGFAVLGQTGDAPGLVRLVPRRGDRALGLLLRRREHPFSLLARVDADSFCFLLSLRAELGNVIVSLALLGLRLIVSEPEDLGDALADLLVRRPAG